MTDAPNTLILSRLVEPFDNGIRRINEVHAEAVKHSTNAIVVHGLYAMVVATFEVTLLDALQYYLKSMPGTIPNEEFKIDKARLLETNQTHEIIDFLAEMAANKVAYESTATGLKKFLTILGIEGTPYAQATLDELTEMKETRNLLMHNNLIVNRIYVAKAGETARSKRLGDRLVIDAAYFKATCDCLIFFLDDLKSRISKKYAANTKINLMRKIWEYFYGNKMFKYDDFWNVDLAKDTVSSWKEAENESKMSSGERDILCHWRSLFSGDVSLLESRGFYGNLDEVNRRKLRWLYSVADEVGLS